MLGSDVIGVSLIVATLGEYDLKPLLKSLENQTCANYECIVVDQSNNRNAEQMVIGFRNIRYLHSTRKGNSYNRNLGIKYARYPIFGFPDDDCVYNPDVIENVLHIFGGCHKNVAAISGIWMDTHTGEVAMGSQKRKYANWLNVWSSITNLTIFIRSDDFYKVKGYDKSFGLGSGIFEGGEETDLVLKVLERGKKILYFPQVRVWHNQDRHVLNKPQKQWGYEESWGALFKKWSTQGSRRLTVIFVFGLFICRSFIAAIMWILRGNYSNAMLYLNKNKARFAGWSKFQEEARRNDCHLRCNQ